MASWGKHILSYTHIPIHFWRNQKVSKCQSPLKSISIGQKIVGKAAATCPICCRQEAPHQVMSFPHFVRIAFGKVIQQWNLMNTSDLTWTNSIHWSLVITLSMYGLPTCTHTAYTYGSFLWYIYIIHTSQRKVRIHFPSPGNPNLIKPKPSVMFLPMAIVSVVR